MSFPQLNYFDIDLENSIDFVQFEWQSICYNRRLLKEENKNKIGKNQTVSTAIIVIVLPKRVALYRIYIDNKYVE